MNKITPKLYKKLIDSIAFICLILVFFFTFFYLKNWQKDKIEERQKTSTVWRERKRGTWCTIKSNSLDGIPLYNEAGGNVAIGSLPEGKLCNLIESTKKERKEWGKVEYAGLTGWVQMSYLNYIYPQDISINKGSWIYINVSTEKGIRIYKDSRVNSDVQAEGIFYGTEFNVKEVNNGWGKVSYNKKEGWLNLYYAGCYPERKKAAWKVETLSRVQQINFREKPGENQRSIAKIPENTYLEMSEFKNGWGKTEFKGQEGWVKLSYLTPCKKKN